jgi:carbon storage regulator CsrA
MLVLSRKSGESIRIGENVTIEVRRIAGNRVTIAVEAPRDVRILRSELEAAVKEFELEMPAEEEGADRIPYMVSHNRIAPLLNPTGA